MDKKYRYSFREVAQQAQGRWIEILQNICQDEKLNNALAKPNRHFPDPRYGGKDGFRVDRDVAFRGGSYSNQHGSNSDGFKTAAFVLNISVKEALTKVAEYLSVQPNASTATNAAAGLPMQSVDATPSYYISDEEANMRKGKLNKYWRQTSKLAGAQSKRVLQYLASRGIKGDWFIKEQTLRFHPSTWYKANSGNLASTPAFVQMWQAPDGTPVNIHKILLSKNNAGKAELEDPKLMMKPVAKMTGGAIRIGEPALGTLSVSAGVENALSVTDVTKQPCWATLTDTLLAGFIPPEDVKHLTIWAEYDFEKLNQSTGEKRRSSHYHAKKLKNRLAKERPDMEVVIKMPSTEGWDWNDVLLKGDRKEFFTEEIK